MPKKNEPIAIIGLGCKMPGNANSPEEFWDKVLAPGVDAITEIPADRWDNEKYYHPDYNMPGKISVKWGGFINDIDKFDAQFFSIAPKEAIRMDPQQRLALEVSYEALEDAGLDLNKIKGKNVGVFMGVSATDYGSLGWLSPAEHVTITGNTVGGGSNSIVTNRISYVYDFRGPSYTVDTACSSSLIALHNATRSIWNDECEMALAGGVNMIIRPETAMSFSKGGFLSPDGRSKAFDESANGYIRSEGIGVAVLKPLSAAERDGDKIYGLILSSATNQDGASDGLHMPRQEAQIDVMNDAYSRAGIDPSLVQYIEAHGTGTAVGDPIECTSIGEVIGSKKKKGEKVVVGTVKTNVGHLEPASGMAGLIKLLMAMKYKKIPKNLHFKNPNPKIKFKEYNIEVPVDLIDWPAIKDKNDMYTGINSFGFGGANAHIVLKGYEKKAEKAAKKADKGMHLLVLSAKSAQSLKDNANKYIKFVSETKESLQDICYTALTRRTHHDHRLAIAASTKEDLIEKLTAFVNGEARQGLASSRVTFGPDAKPKLAFVYSGQGPQWWGMGRELYESEPVFKKVIEDIDAILKELGWLKKENSSLIKEFLKDEKTSRVNETEIAQPLIFAVQVGLTEMWKSMGVNPDGIVGHSIGEVAAAYASGSIDLSEATRLIYWRSKSQSVAAGKGKMLAVALKQAEAQKVVEPYNGLVCVAVINGPKMLTLSGDTESLEKIAADLEKKDVFNRFLKVDVPFHSHYLDVIKDEFLKSVGKVKTSKESTPLYSAVTGKQIDGKTLNADLWYRNIRETVLFYHAVKEMMRDGYSIFVEIAPHPILSASISDTFEELSKKGAIVPSLRRKDNEKLMLTSGIGQIYTTGYALDTVKVAGEGKFIDLPLYSFAKESLWLESVESKENRFGKRIHPHVRIHRDNAVNSNDHLFDIQLDKRLYPYIEDHKVQGPIIFPGAGSCELALTCGMQAFGDKFRFIEDINFKKAVYLPDDGNPPEIQFNLSASDGSFGIFSRKSEKDSWTRHIYGKLRHLDEEFELEKVSLDYIKARCTEPVDFEPMYDELYKDGLLLGPTFRSVTKCWRHSAKGEKYLGEALGELHVPESIVHGIEQFNFHPAILDACFQALFGSVPVPEGEKLGVMVPVHIDKIRFYKKPTLKLYSYGRLKEIAGMFVTGELRIYDENGELCLDIDGFRCRYIEGTRGEDDKNIDNHIYEYQWNVAERADQIKSRKPGEYIPEPASVSGFIKDYIESKRLGAEKILYDTEFEPQLNILTIRYIEKCLYDLGFKFEIGHEFTMDSFVSEFGIIKGYMPKLVKRTLDLLAEYGTFEKTAKGWKVLKKPEAISSITFYNDLYAKYPAFIHELNMLGKCGPFLADIFTGKVDPVELLFPDEEWENTVKFYQESHSFKKYNEMVREALSELLKNLPADKTLRIAEVGAGTGSMTNVVLPILPADRTNYLYTDLSPMFMMKAEERFADYPFIQYKILDISKDLEEQGVVPNSYDLVIASDVVHATPNIASTLTHVQNLLAPNGLLIMLEVSQCPWWVDLVFGLTEGWWMFEDYDLRPDHPTMPFNKWEKMLKSTGYHSVYGITDAGASAVSAQTVIMARNRDYEIVEQKAELPESANGSHNWLVFNDKKGAGDYLVKELSSRGEKVISVFPGESFADNGNGVFTASPYSQSDMAKIFEKMELKEAKDLRGIVHLWNLNHVPTEQITNENLEEAYALGCSSVLNMLRELFRNTDEKAPHLWIVTSGATHIGDLKHISPSQAGVWGMARSMMHEHQHLGATVIDISHETPAVELDSLLKEICADDQMEEVALRGKTRYLHKYVHVDPKEEAKKSLKKITAGVTPFHLIMHDQGILDNLRLEETSRKTPGKGEIEIQVCASALNFKDVMIATGMLHEDAPKGGYTGKHFGMECSGIVTALGAGVDGWKIGDEVVAIAADTFASFAITKSGYAYKKPSNMTHEEAATLPFAYITAYYSLIYPGRMEEGEKVLIHAGSGGVGLAGVRLAQQIGAEVFATAGSEEKRAFLKSIGVKHVYDSRSLKFAEEIMRDTNGEGVDIILNSLSGDAIYKSMSILSKYGRFIEIGKTDIYENSRLSLRPFWNNLTYSAVDIDKLLNEKPALCERVITEMMTFFGGESAEPHPFVSFKIADVVDAFREMASARHTGKVVIKIKGEELYVNPSPDISDIMREDGTYVVVGGLSGLGMTVAGWLADKGAKNLVLIGRSGAKTDEAKAFLESLKTRGVHAMEAKVDAADKTAMFDLFQKIKKEMPPVRGVVNSALVLEDAILPDMTHEKFMVAIRPKVMGAWNLHNNIANELVDFFISFSSIAAEYGTPAQSNYAAANLFLDMFSYYRQANGFKATTISWGAISNVGFVSRSEKVGTILSSQGWRTFTPEQCLDAINRIVMQGHPHKSAFAVDWQELGKYYIKDKSSHRFAHLFVSSDDKKKGGGDSLRKAIAEAEASKKIEILKKHVTETIARILGASAAKIDPETPINNMGLDSLMANQLRNWIHVHLDVEFSMMKIMRGPSINELSNLLLNEMGDLSAEAGSGADDAHHSKSDVDKWFVRRGINPKAKHRLFCFPYMAGGASTFSTWADTLPAEVEVCAVQYPGREERSDENPIDDVEDLIRIMGETIEPLLDIPFSFYGHSIGAGIAFKFANHIKNKYNKLPSVFFAGGWIAPHLKSPFKIIENLKEEDIRSDDADTTKGIYQHMRNLEIPEEVLSNKNLMKEMLPSIKADIIMGKRYRYDAKSDKPLDCPLIAFAGDKDTVFTVDQVNAWDKHSTKEFKMNVMKGGHIFLRDDREGLLVLLMSTLQKFF